MARSKGYCSPRPSDCRAAHYVDPVEPTLSLCGRSPIRFTNVSAASRAQQKAFREKAICDFCQDAVHNRRAHR